MLQIVNGNESLNVCQKETKIFFRFSKGSDVKYVNIKICFTLATVWNSNNQVSLAAYGDLRGVSNRKRTHCHPCLVNN